MPVNRIEHENNDSDKTEKPEYLNRQIITYLGNKRRLLPFIGLGLQMILSRLNRKKIKTFDVFSGSGIVARYLKRYSQKIIVNDMEKYSQVINSCYLSNVSNIDMPRLYGYYDSLLDGLKEDDLKPGFIADLYAPKNGNAVKTGDRVFYTYRNACYIDTARKLVEYIPPEYRNYFLAPLLYSASVHSNTSGVFKGFYKDSETGIGKFGGNDANSLPRITGNITVPFPVFSDFECEYEIRLGDSNTVSDSVEEVDMAYIDPPYNQHPYGSNYFMLNLITDYIAPERISSVSGIPHDWNRSLYNKKAHAYDTFKELAEKIKAKFLMVSFNSEGFISFRDMIILLNKLGKVKTLETEYNSFRGGRNLKNRNIHIKEYLYLVEKH